MRNMVDPNRRREDAQDLPSAPDVLKGNAEEVLMSGSNLDDSHREPVPQPMGRCPMHAILEELGIWPDQGPDL